NVFTLTGNINLLATVSGSQVNFTLQANANMNVGVGGNTIFSFAAAGGIQLDNSGVAAVLSLSRSGSLPSSLGFNLSASYLLELNTTSSTVTLAGISLPAEQAMIQSTGDLTL